ncbi:MAG: radical SAM protein [Anaerolineae bacterium]|nr:radical SAM protein [Anaerolineae bacterium]
MATQHDSVCDCACFAVEGGAVPPLSRPLSFYLELTPACNNNCLACGNTFMANTWRTIASEHPPLPAAGWRQVVEWLRPFAYRLKLTGGEPTLHPEFVEIVRHLATTGIPFTLFTNGRWRDADQLLGLLAATPNFEGLLVSLHGSHAAHHEAFTATPGSFDDTVQGVRAAVKRSIGVNLSCVLTAHNWDRIDEMVALAHRLGTQGIVFNRYLGRPMAGLAPTPDQLHAAIERVEALRTAGARVKLGNCVPTCFLPTAQPGCLAGVAFLTIDPWGRARPCNHTPEIVGHVLEQPIEHIWHSPEMKAWRQSRSEACTGCAVIDTCRGGCRALAATDPSGHDPLMRAPLTATSHSDPVDVFLYTGSRPMARFARRAEAFGPLLLRGNHLCVATRDDETLIDLFDGEKTVADIEARCGQRGVDLVASLYYCGMIDLL